MNSIRPLATLLLYFIAPFTTNGQISVDNISMISKIRGGTTYVVMNDPSLEENKEYIKLFQDYWTISKVAFIKSSEIKYHFSSESSFLTFGVFGLSFNSNATTTKSNGVNITTGGFIHSPTYFFDFRLWMWGEKRPRETIASVKLYVDYPTSQKPDSLTESTYNYDGEGHIRNWGLGILKNYIQAFTKYCNQTDKKFSIAYYESIFNDMELPKLKTDTLYIPDYVLIRTNKTTGNEKQKYDEQEIFENYKFNYKIIPTAELNSRILSAPQSFYYLLFVRQGLTKYIVVINSGSGEIVYSKAQENSHHLKRKDLRKLYDKITSYF